MNFAKMMVVVLILLLTVGTFTATAQMREVTIPNTGLLNCIRDFIVADLAATDTATVNNTKYLLERGETYIHSEQYQAGHKIWLEAASGDGARPRILAVSLGGEAPRLLRMTDNMTFIGFVYEGLDSNGDHTDNAPLRQRGNFTRLYCKDVVFLDHRHEVGRVDGGNQSWLVEDIIVARNYRKNRWHFGYTWSWRNQENDSMIVRNSTFYNTTAGVMHSNNQGGCKYMEFSGNTFYAHGGLMADFIYTNQFEAALINFGPTQNVVCENNLIIDCMTFGYNPIWADSISVFNVDLTDTTESVVIGHNNVWRDPEWDTLNPDTLEMIKLYDPELDSLNTESPFPGMISEKVEFNNVPSQDELKQALADYLESSANTELIYLELPTTPSYADVDFGYAAKLSATGSTTGGPLGDKRWFDGVTVGIGDAEVAQVAESFELNGNYPNPFNPSTTISFNLPQAADVQIQVMNILGQKIYETPVQSFNAGVNKQLDINGSNWASGVYFYRVTAEMTNSSMTKIGKMMLLK